jgi:hypothetical protein
MLKVFIVFLVMLVSIGGLLKISLRFRSLLLIFFKIMCDASDFAVGSVLGQRVDKKLNVIHYASNNLDAAQKNYATTEKEFLAVVLHVISLDLIS